MVTMTLDLTLVHEREMTIEWELLEQISKVLKLLRAYGWREEFNGHNNLGEGYVEWVATKRYSSLDVALADVQALPGFVRLRLSGDALVVVSGGAGNVTIVNFFDVNEFVLDGALRRLEKGEDPAKLSPDEIESMGASQVFHDGYNAEDLAAGWPGIGHGDRGAHDARQR
jgi:hypothetical protein